MRLECRVPARERAAVWRRGRLARGRREAREVRWRLGPFDTRWHWSRIAARIPLCSDDLTLLCVLMFSARENLRGDSMGERSWNPCRGRVYPSRQCGASTCGTSRKQVRSGRDVPGARQLVRARGAGSLSRSSGEGRQRIGRGESPLVPALARASTPPVSPLLLQSAQAKGGLPPRSSCSAQV